MTPLVVFVSKVLGWTFAIYSVYISYPDYF